MASLGIMVDQYISARAVRLDLEKQAKVQKEVENKLAEKLLAAYKKQNTDRAAGKLGYAKLQTHNKARIGDWTQFCQYVAENDAFDLFEKRVSQTAVEARQQEGEEVPGLDWYVHENFSVGGV